MAICDFELQVGVVDAILEVEVVECDPATGLDVIVDISTATVKEITVKRPDNTTFNRLALFTSNGSDALIYILTIAGDITIEGTYYIQGYVTMPGWSGFSSVGQFEAHENLG